MRNATRIKRVKPLKCGVPDNTDTIETEVTGIAQVTKNSNGKGVKRLRFIGESSNE